METSEIVWLAVAAILIYAFVARILREHHITMHQAHLKTKHMVQTVKIKEECRR